jgi:hypothetical protein
VIEAHIRAFSVSLCSMGLWILICDHYQFVLNYGHCFLPTNEKIILRNANASHDWVGDWFFERISIVSLNTAGFRLDEFAPGLSQHGIFCVVCNLGCHDP